MMIIKLLSSIGIKKDIDGELALPKDPAVVSVFRLKKKTIFLAVETLVCLCRNREKEFSRAD